MFNSRNFLIALATATTMMGASSALAFELTPTNASLSENFDSMWSSDTNSPTLDMPKGWKIDRNLTAPRRVNSWESASSSVMYSGGVSLASNASNGTYNFGSAPTSSDRAIGGLTTTVDGGTRCVNIMTKLTNADPAQIITGLTLNYNIEKYRKGSNAAGFTVRIFTSSDGEKWTDAGDALTTFFEPDNETLGAAEVPISVTPVTNQALRTHVEAGKDLYVAWNISVASGSSPNLAPGLAIDDIVLTATFADSDPDWVEQEEPDFNPSGIYMRGVDGVWDAQEEWEFSKLSDTQFALYNKTISGTFKVADAGWSSSCNYGSNGSNILMGEPYALASGVDTNISCGANTYSCARILLTIENGSATLLLEPNEDATGLTKVYMVGDFNSWNYMNTSGELKLDEADNLFKGRVSMNAGADGLSHWMIYQRLGMAGAWGLESDATSSSLEGTLTKGATGHAAASPATYDVTFSLESGAYTLTKVSASVAEMKLYPAATVLVPRNPDKVKVLSLNNSLIHYNDQARVFNEIAESMGKDAEWTKHTNLGKTLQYHWEEGDGLTPEGTPGAKMTIRSDAWSHIILQEQTALPRTNLEDFRASVKQWVEYIRENCPNPNAVIILPMNWHYAQDWSNFDRFNKQMFVNYADVASELGVVVCPVAVAYQSKFEKSGGPVTETEWFLPGDDRHPTIRATYMAACMEYGLIFNEDPTTISYFPAYTTEYDSKAIDATIAADMRSYAAEALKNFNNVVSHHDASVLLTARLLDDFGMEVSTDDIAWSVDRTSATVTDGLFHATENGEYTVTATAAGFSQTATILVTDAVTEVPSLPAVSLSNDNLDYTQDFNSMGDAAEATLPEGWRIDRTDAPRTVGTFAAALENTANAGGVNLPSNAKNGIWNFGASDDNTDRAVGGITTGVDGGARAINVYAHFVNDGTRYISSIDLSYSIEKYRDGNNAAGFTVKLYKSIDGRNWTEAGSNFVTEFPASSATAGAAIVPIETVPVTGTITDEIGPGCDLYLAWNISVSSGTACASAPALAIDDVAVNATLRPIPTYDYYIYIENQAGYDRTAVYAWGDKEIWGSWPGQSSFDIKEISGTVYEVFGHNEADGNYNLIYNNANNGSQLNDYAIVGGRDYYFQATPNGLKEVNPAVVSEISAEAGAPEATFDGTTLACPGAHSITVFTVAGIEAAKVNGSSLNASGLPAGFYIGVCETPSGRSVKRFAKF